MNLCTDTEESRLDQHTATIADEIHEVRREIRIPEAAPAEKDRRVGVLPQCPLRNGRQYPVGDLPAGGRLQDIEVEGLRFRLRTKQREATGSAGYMHLIVAETLII